MLYSFVTNHHNNDSIEMIGQGSTFLVPNETVAQINDILQYSGLQPLTSNLGRVFVKAKINGKMYFGKENKKVKKRNDYTVSFKSSSIYSISYGIINHFLSIDDYSLAEIQHLHVKHSGPIKTFASNLITPSSHKILFEDYFTCNKGRVEYILAEQIVDKLCNLSNDNLILITSLVNNAEIE